MGTLTPAKRRQLLIEYLLNAGTGTAEDLSQLLGVSPMTIYRDVAELEKLKMVERRHGQILAGPSSLSESSAQLRATRNEESKSRLASAVREQLKPGMSLLLDDSTTNIALAKDLSPFTPLTVATNAEFVASLTRPQSDVTTVLIGGRYERWADAYFGSLSKLLVSQLRFDLCIMSATALDARFHYHPEEQVASLKQTMLTSAARKILVADTSKFDRWALHQVGPLAQFDLIITQQEANPRIVAEIRQQKIPVQLI